MQTLFLKILDMNRTAAVVILVVLLIRLLLKKAPKKWSYALWCVVGFRLICPVSFQSLISLFNLQPHAFTPVENAETTTALGPVGTYLDSTVSPTVRIQSPSTRVPVSVPAADPSDMWLNAAAVIWALGIAALLIYSIIVYVMLRRRLRTAILLEGNVWQSDQIRSPFILGFAAPRIYIPFGLDDCTQRYVLIHERFHLKHLDHWIKAFAFLLLAIHWFDPLVWLAFHLMNQDMEMRCDEAVLTQEPNIRTAYSTSLLSFAANRRFPAPGPLAFGEAAVRARIKNVLKWKQPNVWATLLAGALCVAVVTACAADPKDDTGPEDAPTVQTVVPEAESKTATPSCHISIDGLGTDARFFEGDFDHSYDQLTTLTAAMDSSLCIRFQPSWDCDILTVGEDFYDGSFVRRETYELSPGEDGVFSLQVQRTEPSQEEAAIYYIPGPGGEFAIRIQFPAVDPWGLTMKVLDVTTSSLRLAIGRAESPLTGTLQTGDAFRLERLEQEQWVPVDGQTDRDAVWNAIAYDLPAGEVTSQEISWNDLYGPLPAGTYRICKEIQLVYAPGDYDTREYQAVFVINAETGDDPRLLETAISQAILAHEKGPYSDQYFTCESHVTLAHLTSDGLANDDSGWCGQDILYLMVLTQEYEITQDGILHQGGSHMPSKLTFDRYADGTYKLSEYWIPKDGALYESSIKEVFPEFIWEDALDTQKYILPQIQQCYAQAVASAGLDTETIIEGLFAQIAYLPAAPSSPSSYIDAHTLEVRELTYYGDYTLTYIFRHFLTGGETGLNGYLMRHVLDLLIGEEAIALEAETGQAYFDAWMEQVAELCTTHSEEWVQENAPKGYLLIQLLREAT